MEVFGRIYIIKNTINSKVYIGQTTQSVGDRFKQHIFHCKSKANRPFYKAIKEIGKENFYYEILKDNIPVEELDNVEKEYIIKYNSIENGYNVGKGGEGRNEPSIINREKVKELFLSGMFCKDIAKLYGVHKATVERTLHSIGVYKTGTKTINIEELKEKLVLGWTIKEISNYYKVDPRTISRIKKKNNLTYKDMFGNSHPKICGKRH